MAVVPPPLDARDFATLVRDTKAAVREALGLPTPPAGEDPPVPGDGLVHIFARTHWRVPLNQMRLKSL